MLGERSSFLDSESVDGWFKSSTAAAATCGGRATMSTAPVLPLMETEEEGLVGAEMRGEEGGVSSSRDGLRVGGVVGAESCDVGWGEGWGEEGAGRPRCYSADQHTVRKLNLGGRHHAPSDRTMWGRGSDANQNLGSPSSLQMWPLYEDDSADTATSVVTTAPPRQRSMSVGTPMLRQQRDTSFGANVFSRMSVFSLRSAFEYLDQQGREGES